MALLASTHCGQIAETLSIRSHAFPIAPPPPPVLPPPTQKPLLSTPPKRLNHILPEQKRRNTNRDDYPTLTTMLAPAGAPSGSGISTRGRPKGSGRQGNGGTKGKSGVLFRGWSIVVCSLATLLLHLHMAPTASSSGKAPHKKTTRGEVILGFTANGSPFKVPKHRSNVASQLVVSQRPVAPPEIRQSHRQKSASQRYAARDRDALRVTVPLVARICRSRTEFPWWSILPVLSHTLSSHTTSAVSPYGVKLEYAAFSSPRSNTPLSSRSCGGMRSPRGFLKPSQQHASLLAQLWRHAFPILLMLCVSLGLVIPSNRYPLINCYAKHRSQQPQIHIKTAIEPRASVKKPSSHKKYDEFFVSVRGVGAREVNIRLFPDDTIGRIFAELRRLWFIPHSSGWVEPMLFYDVGPHFSMSTSPPLTPSHGCAVNANGSLKDASDITWENSPSDEHRIASEALDPPSSPSPSKQPLNDTPQTGSSSSTVESIGVCLRARAAAKAVSDIKGGKPSNSKRGGMRGNAPLTKSQSMPDLSAKAKGKRKASTSTSTTNKSKRRKVIVVTSEGEEEEEQPEDGEQDSDESAGEEGVRMRQAMADADMAPQHRPRRSIAKDIPLVFQKDVCDGKSGHWCGICK
ncbi:hypothetical protein M422DRAFT_250096 [Sphaerobolus stellatus SS14]|nr:hypothetical protein M422DRAFT_250096 [Sphaerobolus stellatus SS14]